MGYLAREPRRSIALGLGRAVAAPDSTFTAAVIKAPETPRARPLTSDAICITMLQPASRGSHAKETTSTGI